MAELSDLNSALETLEEIRNALASLNAAPNVAPIQAAPPAPSVTQGVADQANNVGVSRLLSMQDRMSMRQLLRQKSTPELHMLFAEQARQQNTGIPYDVWAASGGYGLQAAIERSGNPDLVKALDSVGAAALIRQDLEPLLYELYVRQFPAWDRFGKEPANGLVHAYNQQTSFGDAQFMPELGTVTDDASTYARQTTNVAVIATRRGVSLKSQFATLAGGAGFNPEQLELTGGLRAIAHKMQKTIFQGNSTVSGGTASTEDGAYDANAFDGLRKILAGTGRTVNADVSTATPDSLTDKINDAVTEIINQGGLPSAVYARADEHNVWNKQQLEFVRILPQNQVSYAPGVVTNGVNTSAGTLPLIPVPGDSIGTYTSSGTRADIYALDESTIGLPFLGSDGPTVLDIPVGISGQLTHLFIIFGMWGLAVKAVPFSNKVRVKIA